MLVCSPCFCGTWWIFYIGLCRKGIRTWKKLEGLDVTHEQGKNQLASFWWNSLWKTVCTCHYKQKIEWPQGCPQYVWTVITNTSFPWKSTCQWKLKEKVGKSDHNSMCHKHNFSLPLVKLFLRWAIRASLYLCFHWLFTGRQQQNDQIPKTYYLSLCLFPAVPTGTTVLNCYMCSETGVFS